MSCTIGLGAERALVASRLGFIVRAQRLGGGQFFRRIHRKRCVPRGGS